jgi:carbonic anhydrase
MVITNRAGTKPDPEQVINILKAGNERFASDKCKHPNLDAEWRLHAEKADQGDFAIATVLACSDSRVPVELIFDAGVMDIFTIRIAGNVAGKSQIASIEYSLENVKTPVLLILGHTYCGAIRIAEEVEKSGEDLRGSTKKLLQPLFPAVKNARNKKTTKKSDIVELITEENIWRTIRKIFRKSELTRELVKSGKLKVVGAVYNTGTGKINWLPEAKSLEMLKNIERSE